MGIRILPILLSMLAAGVSGLCGYVHWLAATKTEAWRLRQAIVWQQRLGFSWAESALALAVLEPSREKELLETAARDRDVPAQALVRLSFLSEMEGEREKSREWMRQAIAEAKTYKTYLAAAGQAARLGETEDLLRWSVEALRYCPGEADAVFHLIARNPRGDEVLKLAESDRREDYLRYLLGQERYLPALEYQASLGDSDRVAGLRRELAERLILNQHWEAALRLHPDPQKGGVQNARFEMEPTSLAYDWRLAKHDAIQVEWSPGKLSVRLRELPASRELMSQYVKHSGPDLPRLEPRWQGTIRGLQWKQERLHREWVRVSLVAEPGGEREFAIQEVQVGSNGG